MSSTHSAQSTQSTQLTQSTSQPSQDSSHDSASLNEAASIFLPQGKTLTENQEQTISSILKRKHTMFLAPTGSGKSIAYWVLPLLAEGTKKMVIVVSPLTALIIDQVFIIISKKRFLFIYYLCITRCLMYISWQHYICICPCISCTFNSDTLP